MSTTITESFVRQYETEVHHVFQRPGGNLRQTVRTKDGVVGKSTTFQKIGKGSATTKSRHGLITPMNVDHTPVECTLEDFYAGDYVDRLDEAKVQHDERMALAQAGAMALGRKVDSQIFTQLDATTQSAATLTLTNVETVENSILDWVRRLDANDVPNDGQRYGALTPFAWAAFMKVQGFKSEDYVGPDGLPYTTGAPALKWKSFNGILWTVHTGCPGFGTASAKCFIWHKYAVGHAAGAHPMNAAEGSNAVMADITWHGDRAAHFINHWMSGGAVLVDDAGVIECSVNDTASLPTINTVSA